jgi:hypothetical protein
LEHIVATVGTEVFVATTVISGHMISTVTLDTIVSFDTIVAVVLFAIYGDSSLELWLSTKQPADVTSRDVA